MHRAKQVGQFEVVVPSLDRQLAMDAFAALPDGHPMVGLLELDVTEALGAIDRLRDQGQRVSLFSFLVRAIAVAISEHPDLNLVRHLLRASGYSTAGFGKLIHAASHDDPLA